jgi:Aerotolerance regulator N-terminal/von Willebrand factor type A domain
MTLAAPAFLIALALLVPVLIAFLVRRQRQIVRVPSTMVWRLGARSVAKSRRIRDVRRLLALLACLGGVAALVVAAARPSGTGAAATVYVVDVSASMAGAPLDEARSWLSRAVAGQGPSARIAIVLAGVEPKVALPPSPPGPEVDEAIRTISAEKDISAMDEALSLAEGLASTTGAHVVILTDHVAAASASAQSPKPSLRVFGRPAQQDNLGITTLFTRAAPDARDDEEREATITIATSSTAPRRARLVVTLGGHIVADRRLDVPERGEASERVLLRGGGRLVARIVPGDGRSDVLAIDDEAALDEAARRPPRVALVRAKGEGASAYFVEKAIRAAGVTDLVEVDADGPPPSGAEVAVVLHDGAGRPAGVPAFFVGIAPKDSGMVVRSVENGETHLRSVAVEDPILRGVVLDGITTLRANVAAPPRGARTLVDLDSGAVLVAGGAGPSSWVWLGIDPEASDLVLRVAFPVLVGNVLAHLGGSSQIISAKTVPRGEVSLEASPTQPSFTAAESLTAGPSLPSLEAAREPQWRLPAGPPAMLAIVGAILLALEAWLTFRKRWAT